MNRLEFAKNVLNGLLEATMRLEETGDSAKNLTTVLHSLSKRARAHGECLVYREALESVISYKSSSEIRNLVLDAASRAGNVMAGHVAATGFYVVSLGGGIAAAKSVIGWLGDGTVGAYLQEDPELMEQIKLAIDSSRKIRSSW